MNDATPKPPQNALLGDLESIRALFDDEEESEPHAAEHVPLLDDVVDEKLVTEAPVADQAPGLTDDLFQALLGDEWRASAAAVLDQARDKIEQHSEQWLPEDTDELNAALKVRIDETMQGWMRGMVIKHMADLHEAVVGMLSDELPHMIDEIIASRGAGSSKD